MTIDEEIKHQEEISDRYERMSEYEGNEGNEGIAKDCAQCAADHAQLAEWLMELADLKKEIEYEDFFVIGGRRNSKGFDALVDLFKKIDKKKVQAAYLKAYNESIIYVTSQPTNRTALDEWAYDIDKAMKKAMKKDEFE